MAQTESQRNASDAVAAWLAKNRRNPAWLVHATGADPGTIGDFLNGQRWPKLGTQGKIEHALGWPAGTIRLIGNGAAAPPIEEVPIEEVPVEDVPVEEATEDGGAAGQAAVPNPVGANVDPELIAELQAASPETIEAVRAVLRAARR